ncbi:hypothetical protein [Sorangium sp. So ce1097]|uniref:hypothetical protein n=1 Tax=Sorangium sp. So ce1097 TaxID=3133330 RepID=UPI003F62251A
MPRRRTGSLFRNAADRLYVRVPVGDNDRESFPIDPRLTEQQAEERKELVADLAARLRASRDVTRDATDRPELFEDSDERQPARAHDTRSTFITAALATAALATAALANGRSATWVADLTGHRSSVLSQTAPPGGQDVCRAGPWRASFPRRGAPRVRGQGEHHGRRHGGGGGGTVGRKIQTRSITWVRGEMAGAVDLKGALGRANRAKREKMPGKLRGLTTVRHCWLRQLAIQGPLLAIQ